MSLTRKKVRVKTKSGKTYTRSMMVKSGDTKHRGLAALNPWSPSHTAHVSTDSVLGDRAKFYGSAGPGSDHSWLALAIGAQKSRRIAAHEAHSGADSFTAQHAADRRTAAIGTALDFTVFGGNASARADWVGRAHTGSYKHNWTRSFADRYGRENVHDVHQDPRKWTR